MQQDSICKCCGKEETAPVWQEIMIYHDFDATGQEIDPIATGTYDIIGFKDHCPSCAEAIRVAEAQKREQEWYSNKSDLPF